MGFSELRDWLFCRMTLLSISVKLSWKTQKIHILPRSKCLCHCMTRWKTFDYSNVIMSAIASQITSLTIVCSTVYSGIDQRKHQSSASLAFVWGIHWPTVQFAHASCPLHDWECSHTCRGYPGYFWESHWKSMGLPKISRVTWQFCVPRLSGVGVFLAEISYI